MAFKYIELFAGIGGFRSALDGLGGECVFASEIDKYASQAYKALYDGAPELHGDITKIDTHDIPDHDVLVGGFPCQAFSISGKRKGFEDARGTLFFEIARIASAKQPRLMLLENVKGLLSHDGGNTFETMCVILNDIGYAIDFKVLNSKHFNVPQNRERIFIVADRDAEDAEWDVTGSDVVAKAKRRAQALGVRTFNFDWPENGEVNTRLRDVLETKVDEKYYLGEEKTAKLIAQLENRGQIAESDDCEMIGHVEGISGHDICRRVYTPTGVAPTIPTGTSGNTTPKIAEILEGPRCVQQNQQRKVFIKDEVGSLHASMTNNQAPKILESTPRYRIRKLTPRECWRLQGFTDTQHDAVAAAGISDSQRYKQAGNAVTVNVIKAIGSSLVQRLKIRDMEAV